MKKTSFFVLLFGGFLFAATSSHAAQLSVGNSTIGQGGVGEISVSLSGADAAYAGVNGKLIFPDGVVVSSITAGALLGSSFALDYRTSDSTAGSEAAFIAYSGLETFGPAGGVVLSLVLHVASDAALGEYDINFATQNPDALVNSKYALSNDDGSASITPSVAGGKLTITVSTIPGTTTTTTVDPNQTTTTIDPNAPTTTTTSTFRLFCIDRDGDGYGLGFGCLGFDCNDYDHTVWDNCTTCGVMVFPGKISKFMSFFKRIRFFVLVGEDNTFNDTSVVTWDTEAIETLFQVPVGKRKRVLLVMVRCDPKLFELNDEYELQVEECIGKVTVKLL